MMRGGRWLLHLLWFLIMHFVFNVNKEIANVGKKYLNNTFFAVEVQTVSVSSVNWLSDGIAHTVSHMITGQFEIPWSGLGKEPCNISPLVRNNLLMWLAQAFSVISLSHWCFQSWSYWCWLWALYVQTVTDFSIVNIFFASSHLAGPSHFWEYWGTDWRWFI